ncbi:putative cytochrome P450 4d14 [Haematobia irritans]|uniref:putative cytochrome P450 4d14 n=1 Tax=Haematobia irritans TaxID=7368 RepID=UPI003F4FB0D6
MLGVVISLIFLSLILWDCLQRHQRNLTLKQSHIKGPLFIVPFIGDAWLGLGNDTANVFRLFARLSEKYGKVFRLWLFYDLMLVTKDVRYFEIILSSPNVIKKSFIYEMLSSWLGDGLLLSFSSKWYARRKLLTPTYHFKILDQFVEVFDQQSRVLIKRLSKQADGKTALNMFPIICLTALDIITETAMGVKVNAQNHPDFPYAKAVNELMLVTSDVKYFEAILSSSYVIKKSFIYDMLSPWLSDGLLLSSSSKWHIRRKLLTPTYHFKILEGFIKIFEQQSRVLVTRLSTMADGKTIYNIFPIICLTALDVIAETAMGVKINAQDHPDFSYAKAVKAATDIIATRAMKPIQYFHIGFLLTAFPSYLKLRKCIRIMHDFTNKVICDRKRALESELLKKDEMSTGKENDPDDIGQKKRMTFLDVLLQSTIDGKSLTNEEIREEVDTFMFEGHDTTTSGISFCLYLLARHPAVQQKVVQEIIEVMGKDRNQKVTMKDLQEMKYLEAVIKESLRLYPSVPIISRYTDKDIKVDDNHIIPAHSSITLLIYAIGRNPDIFKNPNDFLPERFYHKNLDSNHNPFAYTPFSAGPRNCIGQKFAMLEMKCTISMVLRYFELLPLGPDVVPQMNMILRSATGINLGLRPRIH